MADRINRQVGFGLLTLLTALLSIVAAGDGTLPGDTRLQRLVQRAPATPFESIADFGNWAGSAPVCGAASVLAILFFAIRRDPYAVIFVLLAYALRLQNMALKSLFKSPRPTEVDVRVTEIAGGYGFPSGHAMGATLCYGAFFIIAGYTLTPEVRRIVRAMLIAIVVTTMFGRVYVGAHWPADVAGGVMFGTIMLIVVTAALSWGWRRYLHREPPSYTQSMKFAVSSPSEQESQS